MCLSHNDQEYLYDGVNVKNVMKNIYDGVNVNVNVVKNVLCIT